ncbi:MAG: hypothetical protein VKO65_03105 [Cyanobacteriota bacterium]|nr:hypothetical protein [Cyanobacteriota bacterium]
MIHDETARNGSPLSNFATMHPARMITRSRRTKAILAAVLTAAGTCLAFSPAAQADEEAKIEARVGAWGRNCKTAIAAKYNAKSMADVDVSLGESLRASIDAGELSLNDIKSSGLSYNFRVHHVKGKDPQGYCNTDGEGNVDEIRNMHD